ncbi:enolase C-terminal domain-like protein [Methylobacterium sp. Leaf117]|uniref:enolase C-terminal domain-like protein n=1 Tax=Methylobacterium sp. Leaf117 TaxID=1736260 RepID=UPI0006FAAF22|nr:enolase C-terminal domain-like protein [Methylobacterium sp. Leaf117]KQP80270.1 mandelate racemase [Methylobacterium sp. Leaf117]
MRDDPMIASVQARAYTVPTDAPEADGTLAWDRTTIVVVHVEAGGESGLGYSYTDASAAALVGKALGPRILGLSALDIPRANAVLRGAVRNLGRTGLAANAISAFDTALWDLKAKLLGLPLARLLGQARDSAPIYGSGGFTSYDDRQLRTQLSRWVEVDGCSGVKMKVGSEPCRDPARMQAAKQSIGKATLFIDANGAFTPKAAIAFAEAAKEFGVAWFEEPVTSDDLAGLADVRAAAPPGMEIAAGEYVYTLDDLRGLLEAGAVDVAQADVTRCGGYTGFLEAAVLCEAAHLDLSGHCAPALHLPAAVAVPRFRHLEWFHDHVRIEAMFFDGAPVPCGGTISPDLSRPGHGLNLKSQDADAYAV